MPINGVYDCQKVIKMIIKKYEYSLLQEIRSGLLKIVLLTVCFLFLSSEVEKLKAPGGWLLVID